VLDGYLVYTFILYYYTQRDGTHKKSPSEFEILIHLMGDKISKKDKAFRKAVSVQERLALTLRFLASGDSYVSLQYLIKISKQPISCIVQSID
jgi:hypothetical protein